MRTRKQGDRRASGSVALTLPVWVWLMERSKCEETSVSGLVQSCVEAAMKRDKRDQAAEN